MRIFQTEDGYKFYLQADGRLTDHPNPENADLVENSFCEFIKNDPNFIEVTETKQPTKGNRTMQTIIVYLINGVDEQTFETTDDALEYLIEAGHLDATLALIEYDGAGSASVFDHSVLSGMVSGYLTERETEKENDKALASRNPL